MEYEAARHVRDSMQLVENAVLERDQVIIKSTRFTYTQKVLCNSVMTALFERFKLLASDVQYINWNERLHFLSLKYVKNYVYFLPVPVLSLGVWDNWMCKKKGRIDTSRICFNTHETMVSNRGWQWDRNAFSVIFHIQSRFQAVIVRAYWSEFGKCV